MYSRLCRGRGEGREEPASRAAPLPKMAGEGGRPRIIARRVPGRYADPARSQRARSISLAAGESFRKSGLTINRYVRRTSYVWRRGAGNTAASRATLSRCGFPPPRALLLWIRRGSEEASSMAFLEYQIRYFFFLPAGRYIMRALSAIRARLVDSAAKGWREEERGGERRGSLSRDFTRRISRVANQRIWDKLRDCGF